MRFIRFSRHAPRKSYNGPINLEKSSLTPKVRYAELVEKKEVLPWNPVLTR